MRVWDWRIREVDDYVLAEGVAGDWWDLIGGCESYASWGGFDMAQKQWRFVGSFYGAEQGGADGSDCGAVASELEGGVGLYR